jgi:hypothetical protein
VRGSGEVAGRSDSGGWTRRVATSNKSEKRLQVIGEQGERGEAKRGEAKRWRRSDGGEAMELKATGDKLAQK